MAAVCISCTAVFCFGIVAKEVLLPTVRNLLHRLGLFPPPFHPRYITMTGTPDLPAVWTAVWQFAASENVYSTNVPFMCW